MGTKTPRQGSASLGKAPRVGLEPTTNGLTVPLLCQLSYRGMVPAGPVRVPVGNALLGLSRLTAQPRWLCQYVRIANS